MSLSRVVLVTLVIVGSVSGQFRPGSLPGILSLVRFQNTACTNGQGDSGTCLAADECGNRRGQGNRT